MQIHRRDLIRYGAAAVAAGLPLTRAAAAEAAVFVNKIALVDGTLLMAALVEGKGPYFFELSTASPICLIRDALAKSLKLDHARSQGQLRGVGGVSDYSWYSARQVELAGGTRLPDMLLAGVRNDAFEPDVVGLFGAGLFTSYDSDLDIAKGQWRSYPKGRPNYDGFTELPSRFSNGGVPRPEVRVSVDGFEDWFAADTSTTAAVSLSATATKQSGLWDDARPYAPIATRGVGRAVVPRRAVRVKRIKVGPFVLEQQVAALSPPRAGDAATGGTLGLAALRHLNLSTRVSTGKLWAAPSGIAPEPERYSLSGLWLSDQKGRIVVSDVGTGSPAAAAGVRKGDVLIGGDLKEAIRAVGGPAGKQVSLTVERGGTRQQIGYTLAPWL